MADTITIPLEDYERLQKVSHIHDKQDVIKDLQFLLINKDEDLKRYREKYEQSCQVLKRTQQQLDMCLKNNENLNINNRSTGVHVPLIIPSQRRDNCDSSGLVSRSLKTHQTRTDFRARAVGEPVEHDEEEKQPSTYSLPVPESVNNNGQNLDHLKSLPVSLGTSTPSPATKLLKVLIQENVKLKAELQRCTSSSKIESNPPSDTENVLNQLKLEIAKKQQRIEQLEASCNKDPITHDTNELVEEVTQLSDTVERQKQNLEINKIVINSLKKEVEEATKQANQGPKNEITLDRDNDTIINLRQQLEETKLSRSHISEQLESYRDEVVENERKLETLQQQYDNLTKKYQLIKNSINESSSSPASPRSNTSVIPPRPPISVYNRQYEESPYRAPPLPPRGEQLTRAANTAPRHATAGPSHYTAPVMRPQQHAAPQPADRKTYKCPRCVTPFRALEDYRQHIKICLSK